MSDMEENSATESVKSDWKSVSDLLVILAFGAIMGLPTTWRLFIGSTVLAAISSLVGWWGWYTSRFSHDGLPFARAGAVITVLTGIYILWDIAKAAHDVMRAAEKKIGELKDELEKAQQESRRDQSTQGGGEGNDGKAATSPADTKIITVEGLLDGFAEFMHGLLANLELSQQKIVSRIAYIAFLYSKFVQFGLLVIGTTIWGFGDIIYLHHTSGLISVLRHLEYFGAVPPPLKPGS